MEARCPPKYYQQRHTKHTAVGVPHLAGRLPSTFSDGLHELFRGLRSDAEGACWCHLDEGAEVGRQFFQEEHEIPPRRVVEEGNRGDKQCLRGSCAPYERRGGARDLGIQKTPSAAVQAKGRADRRFADIQERVDLNRQPEQRPLDSNLRERGILAFSEVPSELGEGDAPVRGNVKGRIASRVPTVVAHASGETSVEDAVWRIGRDVPNAHPAPGTDVSGDHV